MSKVTPYYTGLFAVRKFLKIKGRFSEITILALDSLVQRTTGEAPIVSNVHHAQPGNLCPTLDGYPHKRLPF